jgi:hypothetical protein
MNERHLIQINVPGNILEELMPKLNPYRGTDGSQRESRDGLRHSR